MHAYFLSRYFWLFTRFRTQINIISQKKKKRTIDKSTTILKTTIKYDSHRDRVRDTSNPQQLSPRMRIKRQRVLTVVNPGRIITGQRSLLRGRHVSLVARALVVETTTTLKRWRPVVRGERWFYISIRLRWGHDHFFLPSLFIFLSIERHEIERNFVAGWKSKMEKLDY